MPERALTPEEIQALPPEVRKGLGVTERTLSPKEVEAAGLDVPPPPANVDPGLWKSMLLHFGAGGLKQGLDETTGEIVAGATSHGDVNAYRKARDATRAELKAGSEAHPIPSFLANVAGDIGSDYVASLAGVPVLSTPYQAGVGALSGVLGAEDELTPDKATTTSIGRTAAQGYMGGFLGAAIPKVGTAAARELGAPLLRYLRGKLESGAAATGRRALQAGSDIAARKVPVPDEAILQAIRDKGIVPFGTTQGAYKRLQDLAEQRGADYAGVLKELEDLGFAGPEIQKLVGDLMASGAESFSTSGADKVVAKTMRDEAKNLENLARGATMDAPRPIGPMEESLPLTKMEALKRDLQEKARWGLLSDTPKNASKKEVASKVRQAIEDTIEEQGAQYPEGSLERDLAESFTPLKKQLGRTLAARDLAEVGTSRIAGRGSTNLKDVIMSGAMSGGDPSSLLLNQAGLSLLRSRGPSTAAAGLYGLSRLAKAGAENPQALGLAGAKAAADVGRDNFASLMDWLAARSPEKDKTRALMDYLQKTKDDNR